MNTFTPAMPYSWLFLDLNSYFASVEQQENPEIRGRPVAVIPCETDATCAIAASYEAKAYGIRTGTKIYEAKKLCPDLICVLARHHVYIDYHHKILAEIEKHIPIKKICSVDEVACQLIGSERTPEYTAQLSHDIKTGLQKNIGQMIKCSIGIAPNAFLAKVASNMRKPDGFTVLEPDTMTYKLFALRLTDLPGIGRNMEYRLQRANIHSIEQLWHLEPKHARKIWGHVGGEQFWYKLRGYNIPDRPTTKRMVGHSRMLDPRLRPLQKAYPIARNLTTKAAARLRRYNLYGRCCTLKIHTEDRRRWAHSQTMSPTHDNFCFLKALEDLWQTMQFDIAQRHANTDLRKISIFITDLYRDQDITLDLFETRDQKKTPVTSQTLSHAIDGINKRYGANTVNLGLCPKTNAGYLGTKIAFNRIPELEEFWE